MGKASSYQTDYAFFFDFPCNLLSVERLVALQRHNILYWMDLVVFHRDVGFFEGSKRVVTPTPNGWQVGWLVVQSSKYTISVHLGLSENSVPLNPMVNDHYPY